MMTLKNYNRSIITKYFPPTNTRGARIVAIDGDRRVSIPYPSEISGADCHFEAVKKYMKKYDMDWGENWGYTCSENQNGYLFFAVK